MRTPPGPIATTHSPNKCHYPKLTLFHPKIFSSQPCPSPLFPPLPFPPLHLASPPDSFSFLLPISAPSDIAPKTQSNEPNTKDFGVLNLAQLPISRPDTPCQNRRKLPLPDTSRASRAVLSARFVPFAMRQQPLLFNNRHSPSTPSRSTSSIHHCCCYGVLRWVLF